jgi:hypothetical protein
MLEKRGLPPTLSLLAESLLDGRLPPRSIAWLKIQTIAYMYCLSAFALL